MGDKSPKNTAKTKKQKSQKKAGSVSKLAPKKLKDGKHGRPAHGQDQTPAPKHHAIPS